MVLSVTLNPAVDHQIFVDSLHVSDTNRVLRTEVDAGGKGINLSRVYAELGGKTMATGFLGGALGMFVEQVLLTQGVLCDFVQVSGSTRMNLSVEDNSGKPPTTFNEVGPHIGEQEYEALIAKIAVLAPGCRWVCLGGSLPRGVANHAYRHLGALAKDAGCKVLLDADKEPCLLGLEARPDFIKPNQAEAGRLVGRELLTTDDVIAAAIELRDGLLCGSPDPIVVISRGADGAVLVCSEGVFSGESAHIVPKSTVGSGDSFLGGMLWAMEEGNCGMQEAFRWGLAAGAATATTDGTEIARRGVTELLFGHTSVTRLSDVPC